MAAQGHFSNPRYDPGEPKLRIGQESDGRWTHHGDPTLNSVPVLPMAKGTVKGRQMRSSSYSCSAPGDNRRRNASRFPRLAVSGLLISVAAVVGFPGVALAQSAPDAPTGVVAVAGVEEATVSWTAPADNGSAITSYTVTSSPAGKTCTWSSGALSCVVVSLDTDKDYTFVVTAANAVGTGPVSVAVSRSDRDANPRSDG